MNGSGWRDTRHFRPGFINEETFMRTVEYLRRNVGVDRVTLKTGAYGARELAVGAPYFKAVSMSRLLHGAACCVNCGQCEDACSVDIPLPKPANPQRAILGQCDDNSGQALRVCYSFTIML